MNKQIKLTSLLLVLAVFLFVSCNDDELAVGTKLYPEEQIDMDAIKAYISTEAYPVNNVSWTLYQTPVGVKKPKKDVVSFYVFLSKKSDKDVEINLSDDITLVDKYNKDNETNFEVLPKGAIKILNSKVVIKAGSTKSENKVKATLNYDKLKDFKNKGLGCITINKVSEDTKIASSMNVIYLSLYKEFTNINNEGSLDNAEFVDRTKYNVTSTTDWGASFSINNILDGDKTTSWAYTTSGEPNFQLNLDKAIEVKGLRTIPFSYKGGYNFNVKKVKVYTSVDGEKWKDQGTFTAPLPTSQDPIDIVFYNAVKTKYVKLEIVEGYSNYVGYGEVSLMK